MNTEERFIRYASMDTTSDENCERTPSSDIQFSLARLLVDEMKALGITDARVDDKCYVYGSIPANCDGQPAIGLIAHMDTVAAVEGRHFAPRVIRNYQGGDIMLCNQPRVLLSPADFDSLNAHIGDDLIVTDGTSVLGADDKAGVAEIMTLAETLLTDDSIKHGKICIGFTPDEEIGRGADFFDVANFGADFAYTVDGGAINEIEYENFNAADARVKITGRNIHPGSAKDIMRNAAKLAMAFNALLPAAQAPEHTQGYEGFYHLASIKGDEAQCEMRYIIRDHDMNKFNEKKAYMQRAADYFNAQNGQGTVTLTLTDSYYNMRQMIEPHMHIIQRAQSAIRDCGMQPVCVPIRGGTDGARLSYMGLPCPNLGTGGHNGHGVQEYTTVQDLRAMTNVLLALVKAR